MYAYGYKGKCGCGCCGNWRLHRVTGGRRSNGMKRSDKAAKSSERMRQKKQISVG